MLSKFRRDAAVLATFLAQFDNTDTDPGDRHPAATALTPEERQQRRRDSIDSLAWADATQISDQDIAALTHAATLRFPNAIVNVGVLRARPRLVAEK